uniref:Uncharacterized protein n=1 Tax=Pyrodinium bahamense TaxID=73915 RepID=A0A7S0F8L7_9DINO
MAPDAVSETHSAQKRRSRNVSFGNATAVDLLSAEAALAAQADTESADGSRPAQDAEEDTDAQEALTEILRFQTRAEMRRDFRCVTPRLPPRDPSGDLPKPMSSGLWQRRKLRSFSLEPLLQAEVHAESEDTDPVDAHEGEPWNVDAMTSEDVAAMRGS